MLDKLTARLDFNGKALALRADRQQVLSSNIANADTPGFKARDFEFSEVLADQAGSTGAGKLHATSVATTNARHLPIDAGAKGGGASLTTLKFRAPDQASLDGNTVNLDMERANFADNSMRYEASLRFINGSVRNILSAIRGE